MFLERLAQVLDIIPAFVVLVLFINYNMVLK